MSRTAVIAVAGIFALILGLAAGLMWEPRRANDFSKETPAAKVDSTPKMPVSPEVGTADPKEAKVEPPVIPDAPQGAQELWDLMTSSDTTRTGHNAREKKKNVLKPDMARFFIQKYREFEHLTDVKRQYAMEMAISCGGPDAADFVRQLTENPAEGFMEFLLRTIVADVLTQGHMMRRPKEFPVDDSLMQRTQVMLASARGSDRRLAVAILGYADVHRALPTITERVRLDPDPVVRETALRILARIGTQASLDWLRSEGKAVVEEAFANYQQPQPVRGGPPVRAADKNQFTRVLNDAIEELEERLAPK